MSKKSEKRKRNKRIKRKELKRRSEQSDVEAGVHYGSDGDGGVVKLTPVKIGGIQAYRVDTVEGSW